MCINFPVYGIKLVIFTSICILETLIGECKFFIYCAKFYYGCAAYCGCLYKRSEAALIKIITRLFPAVRPVCTPWSLYHHPEHCGKWGTMLPFAMQRVHFGI